MKKLFKIKNIQIDGFEGNKFISYSYMLSNLDSNFIQEEVYKEFEEKLVISYVE